MNSIVDVFFQKKLVEILIGTEFDEVSSLSDRELFPGFIETFLFAGFSILNGFL